MKGFRQTDSLSLHKLIHQMNEKSHFNKRCRNVSWESREATANSHPWTQLKPVSFYEFFSGSPENSPGNTSSFWSFGRSITDYTPVFKKYQYQIACRSPQSTKSPNTDLDDPSTFRAHQVCLYFNYINIQWNWKIMMWYLIVVFFL